MAEENKEQGAAAGQGDRRAYPETLEDAVARNPDDKVTADVLRRIQHLESKKDSGKDIEKRLTDLEAKTRHI